MKQECDISPNLMVLCPDIIYHIHHPFAHYLKNPFILKLCLYLHFPPFLYLSSSPPVSVQSIFLCYDLYLDSSSFSKLKIIFPHLIVAHCSVTQLCPTLCDPMDCSPPDSSVKGMLQARILAWVAISSSRGSLGPRDRTQVSRISGRFFTTESPGSLPSHCSSLLTPLGSRSLLTSCDSLDWWFDFSEQQPCCPQSLLFRKCLAHQRIPGLRSGGLVSSADTDCPEGCALDARQVPWIQWQEHACGHLFSTLPAPASFFRGARELSTW